MRLGNNLSAGLLLAAALLLPALAPGQSTVTFDFDTGTPPLSPRTRLPVEQTVSGLTASFTAPELAFAVQNEANTGFRLSQFSGNYLNPTDNQRRSLTIQFSRPLTAIRFTFATADFQREVPSDLQIRAFVDSVNSTPVGTSTGRGVYPTNTPRDTMPMGTLSFATPSGRTFNVVEIGLVTAPNVATAFLVDNIVVTPASAAPAVNIVSAASYAPGAPLAANMIASAFGEGFSTAEEAAQTVPLPTTLANTSVTVTDSAGTARPAALYYVGPKQINYLVPEGTAAGRATVTVTSGGRTTATTTAVVERVSPGLFTANFDGRGAPAAAAITASADGMQRVLPVAACGPTAGSCVPVAIDLGPDGTQVVLTLYGTGIRGRSALSAVSATIGGVTADVQYAGAQPEFAGLDQVNVLVPRSLAGRGEVDLLLTVDGRAANVVRINIK